MKCAKNVFCLAKSLLPVFILLTGCYDPVAVSKTVALKTMVSQLQDAYKLWLAHNMSDQYIIDNIVNYNNVAYSLNIYTNQVLSDGKVYHCRFAVRTMSLHGGMLARTDEGAILWIKDNSTNATRLPTTNPLLLNGKMLK
jgi:hypothetical protein